MIRYGSLPATISSGSGASRSSSERRPAPASVGGRARAALPARVRLPCRRPAGLCPHLSYPLRPRRWLRSPNLLDRSLEEVKRHLAEVLQRPLHRARRETPSAYRARDHSWTDSLPARLVRAALMGEPAYDSPSYVGYNVDGQDIGLNPRTGAATGWSAPCATGMWTTSTAACRPSSTPARSWCSRPGHRRRLAQGHLKDADGNAIGLRSAR